MLTLFKARAVHYRHGRVGHGGNDMSALVNALGTFADLHFDTVQFPHLGSKLFAMLARRAEYLQLADVAYGGKCLHMRSSHAAGAQHADHFRILVGHVLYADAAVAADTHVLQDAVIDESQRFSIFDRGEKDQAAVQARPCAVLLLRGDALVFRLVDDIRLHSNREIPGRRSAFHAAELVAARCVAGWDSNIYSWPANGLAGRNAPVGLLERRDGVFDRQDLRNDVIVDKECHGDFGLWARLALRHATKALSAGTQQPAWS